MRNWNFKVKCNPNEVIKKLDAVFQPNKGFVFKIVNNNEDLVKFKIRKRIAYAHQILQQNRIIVNGKVVKTETETGVKISFTHHFLITYAIIETLLIFVLGFMAIITGIDLTVFMYILVGTLLGVGVAIWFTFQKKFETDIQQYKLLISEILEL